MRRRVVVQPLFVGGLLLVMVGGVASAGARVGVAGSGWQRPTARGLGEVGSGAVARAAAPQTRILYASDWEGPTQIFAVDPTGRRPLAQVTFGHAPACMDTPFACGFTDPRASPDDKTIAYTNVGSEMVAGAFRQSYWVANANGRNAHEVATPPPWYDENSGVGVYAPPPPLTSPNGRWTASVDRTGITVTDWNGHRRHLTSDSPFALDWAPNSESIAYIQGSLALPDDAWTGDLKVVSLTGRSRTLVRADGPYGGQIVALTWTRVPKRTAYRRPLVPASGIFVGPVGRLAAGGSRVAFAACGRLSVWVPPNTATSTFAQLGAGGVCFSADARAQYYDLAVGSDRIFWGEKTYGLSYQWSLHARTLGTGTSFTLADGFSGLGCPECDGAGALAASGDLMVFGRWHSGSDAASGNGITTETLFRATDAGCPCTAIAYGAAPNTIAPLVPLDTDGTRIAVLRYGSLVVLDTHGNDLLTTSVAAGGAQIMGNNLLALTDGRLTEYELATGAVQRSWTLPGGTPGRDCHYYNEPHCPYTAAVKLQDAARGLVALTLNGQLHILDVNTGADKPIGYATEARFMDSGLVYADGARINYIPYSALGA